MATQRTRGALTEVELLELFRVSLENVKTQPEISQLMVEFGYDDATIQEGKKQLEQTVEIYESNKVEDDEAVEAYRAFDKLKSELEEVYRLHRKKAKVIFRKSPVIKDSLEVSGTLSKTYLRWLETAKKFYSVSLSDEEISGKLSRLKITKEELIQTEKQLQELNTLRGGIWGAHSFDCMIESDTPAKSLKKVVEF